MEKKYDSTEKHIVATGRMSNIVYKHFYSFELKCFGKVIGSASDDYYLLEFDIYLRRLGINTTLERIFHITELKNCIFNKDKAQLESIILRAMGGRANSITSLFEQDVQWTSGINVDEERLDAIEEKNDCKYQRVYMHDIVIIDDI